ncbi:MAG: hypothetical protein WC176_05850, partial [Candidatus Cloacimonadaceae bacterium]
MPAKYFSRALGVGALGESPRQYPIPRTCGQRGVLGVMPNCGFGRYAQRPYIHGPMDYVNLRNAT